MTGGDGDVLIPAWTFVELETGIRIDLGERRLLRDVSQSQPEIVSADRFADH